MLVPSQVLATFTEQLANLIEAGITLTRALHALEKQEGNRQLKKVLSQVRQEVERGSSFSGALKKHRQVFSPFYINMIHAGEEGAGLTLVMKRVADHMEKDEDLKAKVQGVFAYPVVVAVMACLVIGFLVIVIVPVFAKVYGSMKVDLPLPTRILVLISVIFRKFWWLVGGLIGLAVYFFRRLRQQPEGREFLDRLLMKVPILGPTIRALAIARFVRAFGEMFSSGIEIFTTLEVTDKIVNNSLISRAIENIKKTVREGGTLVAGMSQSDIFPPVVVQMAFAGEEGGSVGEMFEKCANILDRNIDLMTKKSVALLEPILLVILACVVGFIAVSIYLPMFDLVKLVK